MNPTTPSESSGSGMPPAAIEGTLPTVLAPMQDVTTLPFMKVIARCGSPDIFFTEYFRVYPHSSLEKHILASITSNGTDRPVIAQVLGNSLPDIRRITALLQRHPVAGIDLNVGCPAPKIYKNKAGGGLLADLPLLDRILETLRESITETRFSVKIRLGFDSFEPFEPVLELIRKHRVDFVTIHARTVREMYRGEPHYEFIAKACSCLDIPVIANGNLSSPAKAIRIARETGAAGVMIGRDAIRNPWIFRQIREATQGMEPFQPTLADVRTYIDWIYTANPGRPDATERARVSHLKKFVNFIGQGVDPQGRFVKTMRRAENSTDFFRVCDHFLIEGGRDAEPFPMEPYAGVVARPNCE